MTRNDISNLDDALTSKTRSGTLSERLPSVAEALKQAHIVWVRIDYSRGSVQEPRCYTAEWMLATSRLSAAVRGELLVFFEGLIELRYPGWADGLAGFGEINWDVASDILTHWHARGLYEYDGAAWFLEGL